MYDINSGIHPWHYIKVNHSLDEYMQCKEYLKIDDLEIGAYYLCLSSSCFIFKWNGKEFLYLRKKFGRLYPDNLDHVDAKTPWSMVYPLEKISTPTREERKRYGII
jgi:hypothetical protein